MRRSSLLLWAAALGSAAVLGIVGAALAHARLAGGTGPALPVLHGQATWAPGARPAPGPARGRVELVLFPGRSCAGCSAEVRSVVRRLPAGARPLVVVAPESAARAYGVAPGRSALLLVDANGDERTGYALPAAPAFVETDLRTLAAEARR